MGSLFDLNIYKFTDKQGCPVFFMVTEISPASINNMISEYIESCSTNVSAEGFVQYLDSKGYYAEITWKREKKGGL